MQEHSKVDFPLIGVIDEARIELAGQDKQIWWLRLSHVRHLGLHREDDIAVLSAHVLGGGVELKE